MIRNIQKISDAVEVARDGVIAYVRADQHKVEYLTLNVAVVANVFGKSYDEAEALVEWCEDTHEAASNPDHYAFVMLSSGHMTAQKYDMTLMDGYVVPVASGFTSEPVTSTDSSTENESISSFPDSLVSVETGYRAQFINTLHGNDYPYMVGLTTEDDQLRVFQVNDQGVDVDGVHVVRVSSETHSDQGDASGDMIHLLGYMVMDRKSGPQFVSDDYMNKNAITLTDQYPSLRCVSVVTRDGGFSHVELV